MAKKTKKKKRKLTAWEESLVNPKIGPDPQPALKKLNENQLELLRDRIHGIVRYDLYIRVAATLWDAGLRSDTFAVKGRTFSSALCSTENAAPEPYVCNAWNYMRQWEREGTGPDASIPRI